MKIIDHNASLFSQIMYRLNIEAAIIAVLNQLFFKRFFNQWLHLVYCTSISFFFLRLSQNLLNFRISILLQVGVSMTE